VDDTILQAQNAPNKPRRSYFRHAPIETSRFGGNVFTISLCAALSDAVLGQYL
jgi:hypothetical protein